MSGKTKVVHITTVHDPFDVRVFHKECRSLAEAGYDVVIIVPHARNEVVDGVRIRALPMPRTRLLRVTRTLWQAFRAAVEEDAQLYHFHDPELLPAALLLKRRGRQVVYDTHEDYATSIRHKPYLPRVVRRPLGWLWGRVETFLAKPFRVVVAEKYYTRRFPGGVTILNYPLRKSPTRPGPRTGERSRTVRLLYTGNVTKQRGALYCAQIVALADDAEVFVVGRCSKELADELRQAAGRGRDRLHIEGEGGYVPHERIEECYAEGGWTAGLALFPPSPHYEEKELTKFFEYMEAGIPVLCSNFPVWKSLVEESGAGLCADPQRPETILSAIRWLTENPEEAAHMGQRGKELVRTRYNWDTQAERLLALYEEILGD